MKALLLLLKDSPRSRGEMDVSLSITFKITAEIEIRKHKIMFSILLRGGVVSALYEMRLVVSSLVSISLNFIPLLQAVFMARSFAPVVCRRKFHEKGIKFETFRQIT